MSVPERQFVEMFVEEARTVMAELTTTAVGLETAPADLDAVALLLRRAHSLKGSSGMMGFDEIRRVAQAIEDLLEPFRDGGRPVPRDVVDTLLIAIDVASRLVEAVREPRGTPGAARVDALVALIDERRAAAITALRPGPAGTVQCAVPSDRPVTPR